MSLLWWRLYKHECGPIRPPSNLSLTIIHLVYNSASYDPFNSWLDKIQTLSVFCVVWYGTSLRFTIEKKSHNLHFMPTLGFVSCYVLYIWIWNASVWRCERSMWLILKAFKVMWKTEIAFKMHKCALRLFRTMLYLQI